MKNKKILWLSFIGVSLVGIMSGVISSLNNSHTSTFSRSNTQTNNEQLESVTPREILLNNDSANIVSVNLSSIVDGSRIYGAVFCSLNDNDNTFRIIGIDESRGKISWRNVEFKEKIIVGNKDYKLTSIGDNVFANQNTLNGSIVFNSALTHIGNSAFKNCASIYSIQFPESLTYIGSSAFENNGYLQCINLPKKMEHIGKAAFKDCCAVMGNCIFQKVSLKSVKKLLAILLMWDTFPFLQL